jgi:hypothetical protein
MPAPPKNSDQRTADSIKATIVSDRTQTKTASKSAKSRQQIGGDEITISRSKTVST